ncbi:MAG: hypothetical protein LUQ66_02150 [Methanoregula sp.]|nr:hypothetical protein [Methanoregula sp.]
MNPSRQIPPWMIISGIAVLAIIIVLLALSLPGGFLLPGSLHLPDGSEICLYPSAEGKTLENTWDTILRRTGINESEAAFEDLMLHITPDETLDSMTLVFYTEHEGKVTGYTADLTYFPGTCGRLRITSTRTPANDIVLRDRQSPRVILANMDQFSAASLGVRNRSVRIITGVSRHIRDANFRYEANACLDLFLLKDRKFIPLDNIKLNNTAHIADHWSVIPEYCYQTKEIGRFCDSAGSIIVFPDNQIRSADIIYRPEGTPAVPLANRCPHGNVTGQSCSHTFWGSSCTNWSLPANWTTIYPEDPGAGFMFGAPR